MMVANVVGYVFAPVEKITKNDKSFHVLKIKCPNSKQSEHKSYFIECYLSDSQTKYANYAKVGDIVFLTGELIISSYISKTGEAKSKVGMFVKTQKIIHSSKEKPEEAPKEEIEW